MKDIELLEPPKHWRQIEKRGDAVKWRKVQKEHIDKLMKLGVFEVVKLEDVKKLNK